MYIWQPPHRARHRKDMSGAQFLTKGKPRRRFKTKAQRLAQASDRSLPKRIVPDVTQSPFEPPVIKGSDKATNKIPENSKPQAGAEEVNTNPPIRYRLSSVFLLLWKMVEITGVAGSGIGIAYLVYDSYYQTKASLDFAFSDQKSATDNPIYVKNNSNIFSLTNLSWKCSIKDAVYEGNNRISNSGTHFSGRVDLISPGYGVNIACNNSGVGGRRAFVFVGAKLLSAHISISIEYDVRLGWLSFRRSPDPFPFTWVGSIASPQWIRGNFIDFDAH